MAMSYLKERVKDVLTSKNLADVTLTIGQDNKTILAHKFLLSLYSDVFKEMFYGEKADVTSEVIFLEDDVKDFETFFQFMYNDKLSCGSTDETIAMLKFAEKYEIATLKRECALNLERQITESNAIEIYEAANTFKLTDLIKICLNFIKINGSNIIKSTKNCFKNVDFRTVLDIVSEDNLFVDSELDVYDAIVAWGKQRFNNVSDEMLREKIYPLIQQVRFVSMTKLEFSGSPCTDGILTKEEQLEIFREMSGFVVKNDETLQKKTRWMIPRRFQCMTVCYPSSCFDIISRYGHKPQYSIFPTVRRFSTVREEFNSNVNNLCIIGATFKTTVHVSGGLNAEFNLKITNITSGVESSKNMRMFLKNDHTECLVVKVNRPVSLKKYDEFEIILTMVVNDNVKFNANSFEYCNNNDCKLSEIFGRKLKNNRPHFSGILTLMN